MRSLSPPKSALFVVALLTMLVGIVPLSGCGSKTPDDDQSIRAGFEKKSISINDVPPDQRERVKGFMAMNKGQTKPGAPATPPVDPAKP